MKKRVLSTLALGFASMHAQAQSSVTLYGIIDNSIQYAHNSSGKSTQISMVSGQLAGSRWGLLGSEDLGGGLKAVFRLENGFNVNTGAAGQGGRLFGRQAYVGLASDKYGTFTAGRQYDALRDLVLPVQGNNFLEYFTAPGDVDSGDGTIRMDNVVKWTSPTLSGFKFVATYSFGGVAGSPGSGQTWSGGVSYANGPLQAAAGYLHIDNGDAATSARGTTTSGSLFGSVVNSAYSSARSINIVRAATNYSLGPVTLGGYYSFSQYNPDGASKFTGSEHYNNGSVFVLWKVSVPVQLELGYDYMKSGGNSSATYHQVNLAADYLLSKRTDLYAITAYGHASGSNGLGPAQAVIADTVVGPGTSSQEMVILGIRHRF
ncbi:porin [Paraburkholderia ginsengiterrae]|uniref:Porin n=1 Tax=Paraburkholderia ginsengiterrae TaxID=1462993 RepID=A0A1A9NAX7_9BURK|nr:porin [Paraburkholderia ginsengiterrae]OAJ59371.1 porin [Paraburkholderia ginsengiterrae]OAJ63284.1 porin [Paraburkholderia ginsengiterrae]